MMEIVSWDDDIPNTWNKMKPTNPNAHTYVEDNDVKVSIMI